MPAGLIVSALTCEYRTNPLGLGVAVPRISWRIESDARHDAERLSNCRNGRGQCARMGFGIYGNGAIDSSSVCRSCASIENLLRVQGESLGCVGERVGMERYRMVRNGIA